MKIETVSYIMLIVFGVGYLAIIFEYYIKVNKTASALIMAVISWWLLFLYKRDYFLSVDIINEHIGHASQIIFFLLGALALVELIDSHKGFKIITDAIHTHSRKKLLWIIGLLAFFLSAILDNLTTTIVLVTLLRKIVPSSRNRMIFGAAVVVAANAGGAWTPIGDVTTTMLWIKNYVTTIEVIKSLFVPSMVCLLVSLFLLSFKLKGNIPKLEKKTHTKEPGAKIVLYSGIVILMCIPIVRELTGLPPFMGMLIGIGILWLITDIMHYKYEERKHLRVPYALTRIDVSGVLFFLGILLCISSLEIIGVLQKLALFLGSYLKNSALIALVLGLVSAVVDNVPLVAATTGMYSLKVFPKDSSFWQMIAYAAGTGGSVLIIGSAAGVAFMGLEKVDFIWYFKKITPIAFVGYISGMLVYLLIHNF